MDVDAFDGVEHADRGIEADGEVFDFEQVHRLSSA